MALQPGPDGSVSPPSARQGPVLPSAWQIAAPGINAADQATMVPLAVSKDGVLVAGNQKRLHVFRVDSRPRRAGADYFGAHAEVFSGEPGAGLRLRCQTT